MKLSLSAAMRARDISRPHDEHLVAAEGTEPAPSDANGGRASQQEPGESAAAAADGQPPSRTSRNRKR